MSDEGCGTAKTPCHLYLVDGSSYIFRAYHGIRMMTRPDGTPVNAVYGFTSMLYKLLQDFHDGDKPTHVAVIFDAARKTFRNDIYPDYKAHRPPAPDDLVPQFPLVRDATKAFNVPAIDMPGYEADDVIATYVRQAKERGWSVTIVSSDKDLMQLVGDGVDMLDTMKMKRMREPEVVEKFGVGPDRVIDVQALAGDSADNVPGVPGIGVKTAAQLIGEFGDLDTLLARAGEIKQNKRRENLLEFAEQARISRELVTLHDDVPLVETLDDFELKGIKVDDAIAFMDEQSFSSLKSRMLTHAGLADDTGPSFAAAPVVKDVVYECVTDMAALQGWIEAAYKVGTVAVDTETTSLDAITARMVGISLCVEAGHACYIPLRHVSGDGDGFALEGGPKQIPVQDALAALKPMLEDPSILKVGQNIKYDLHIFTGEGIRLQSIDDTMALSYVLESGLHGHGMDEMAQLFLDIKPIPFKEVVGTGKNQLTFDQVDLEKATTYAAEDADITLRLYQLFKPRLAQEKLTTVYEVLERPLIPVLADMEQKGVRVDGAQLNRLSLTFAEGMERLEADIHALVGRPFNIASPKQLGEILFDEMGLKGGKKGKTGAYSTGADVLEGFAAEGHEMPAKVLEWRQLAKLKSTYTDALQKQVNPKTGRVHTSYSIAATTTGRLASSDPNLQNIPIRTEEGRKIRQAFVPEEGFTLLAADYSQIELRILAHMADIPALKQAFHEGLDVHAMTASEVFGVPIEGMDPSVRRKAKAINFGIIYGISAFGLARQIGVSRTEAKDYIEAYFAKFPGIRAYMDRTIEDCRTTGYVETLFGRRCHMAGINDKNGMQRSFAERAAINAPIQGTAADVIRRAMIHMPPALNEAGLGDVRMLLQVHDELVFEVPTAKVEAAIAVIKPVMEKACFPALELSVPLVVDCGTGMNWDEAH